MLKGSKFWKATTALLAVVLVLVVALAPGLVEQGVEGLRESIVSIGRADTAYAAAPDYTCDGVDDNVQFQAALTALPVSGGTIHVLSGSYDFSATVLRAIDGVAWVGTGKGSSIVNDGVTPIFDAGTQAGWYFENLTLDAGGIDVSTATEVTYQNVWIGASYYAYWVDVTSNFHVPTGRSTTLTVAASDSTAVAKAQADYVCSGASDDVEINAALTALPATGGKVLLLDGTFVIATTVFIPAGGVELSGTGVDSTTIQLAADDINWIQAWDVPNGKVSNMTIDCNSTAGYPMRTYGNYFCWENLTFTNPGARHVALGKSSRLYCRVEDVRVFGTLAFVSLDRSHIENAQAVNGALYVQACTYTDLVDCTGIESAGAHGGLYIWAGSTHITVIGGKFASGSVSQAGIELRASYCTIMGVDVSAPANSFVGIDVFSDRVYNNDATHNLLMGNLCSGLDRGIETGRSGTGDVGYNRFIGNDARDCTEYGILEINSVNYASVYRDNDCTGSAVTIQLALVGSLEESSKRSCDIFMDVLAVTANHVVNNEHMSIGPPNDFVIATQPDVPRTLTGHFDSHAQITAYSIDIAGVDAKGIGRFETFTEADGWDWETDNAYATVSYVRLTARTGTGAGDTMDIGIADVLGLSNVIYETGDVYKIKKDNVDATVAAAQVDITYDTYDMSVIGLAATNDFTIWFKTSYNTLN